jgi:hypothetical protein
MEQKKQTNKSRYIIDFDNPPPNPTPELTALLKTRQLGDEDMTPEQIANVDAFIEMLRKERGY